MKDTPAKTSASNTLLAAALRGYEGQSCDDLSEQGHKAWKAGEALARTGRTAPVRCAAARGKTLRLETSGGLELLARFDPASSDLASLERLP